MAESKIVIHNDLDPVSQLYDSKGNLVGDIKNERAFIDVCRQIVDQHADGYYVMMYGHRFALNEAEAAFHLKLLTR